MESLASTLTRSLTLPYSPKTIFPVIGFGNGFVPSIGSTWYWVLPISNVETILCVMLLYVAPTVITSGSFPGLPIVPSSGPLFPAATTTMIPFFTASLTAWSISPFVLFTPKLILITLILSSIAR